MSMRGVGRSTQVGTTENVGEAKVGKFGKFKAALGEARDKVSSFFKGLPAKFSEPAKQPKLTMDENKRYGDMMNARKKENDNIIEEWGL